VFSEGEDISMNDATLPAAITKPNHIRRVLISSVNGISPVSSGR
jgi:hypothetical protein